MTKKKWKLLVETANHLLLTPFEQLNKCEQSMWLAGTRAILKDLRTVKVQPQEGKAAKE